jgi:hypothetical protein
MVTRFLLPAVLVTAFLSVTTAAVSQPVVGYFKTGNDLFADCRPSANFFAQGACMGLILGVADVMSGAREDGGAVAGGWRACLPRIIGQQARDVAVGFLTRHPEVRHKAAWSLVARAFAEAFPCQQSQG